MNGYDKKPPIGDTSYLYATIKNMTNKYEIWVLSKTGIEVIV